jgi:MFS transporter, ACS family, D-galactonate transporter
MSDQSQLPEASHKTSNVRFITLAWLCSLAMLAYIQRNAISLFEGDIRKEFELNQFQMGLVFGSFFWAYAFSQIPAGWLGQRWGSRIGLAVFMGVSSLAAGLSGLIPGLALLVAARVSCGVVQAGMFPACANTVTNWFSRANRGIPSGLLGSSMSVGSMIAASLTAFLLQIMSWKTIMMVYALPGLWWMTSFYIRFRNRPEQHPGVSENELAIIRDDPTIDPDLNTDNIPDQSTDEASNRVPWKAILSTSSVWCVCGQQFFRAAGYIFFATWFPKYLQAVHHVTPAESGYLTSLPMLAVILGGPLGGTLSDWIYRRSGSIALSRKLPGAISQFMCGALIAVAYFIDSPGLAVITISAGMFVFAFGGCCAYTITMDIAGNHVAIVFAVMNMCGNIGAAICPTVVGHIADEYGWPPVLMFFSGIYIAAGICWTLLNTSKTVRAE